MKLFTVGYEGCSIEEFTSFLADQEIECIADLRKNPVSRKKGFSKRLMAEHLAKSGIEYRHYPGLGVPTEWRKQAKAETITRDKMFRDYEKKILPLEAENLNEIKALMKKKRTALLCYEADASDCHRRRVSDALSRLQKRKLEVIDLELHPSEEAKLPRFKKSVPLTFRAAQRRTRG